MSAADATTEDGQQDGPRVLLVDDEAAVLDGLRRQLRGRAEVVTATSGAEALELLATGPAYATVIALLCSAGRTFPTLMSMSRTDTC